MSDWRRGDDETALDAAAAAALQRQREENRGAALRVVERHAASYDWSDDDQTQVKQMLGLVPYTFKPEVKVRRR